MDKISKMFCPACGKYVETYVYIGRCPNCQVITEFFYNAFAAAEAEQKRRKRELIIIELFNRSICQLLKLGRYISG